MTVQATAVHNNTGQAMAADRAFTFHRLFGDANGDKTVNNSDAFQFSTTYLKTSGTSGYLASFDFNGDGTINNADAFQLSGRYLRTMA